MIEIYVGLPGAGKSLKTASTAMKLLKRNVRYYEKTKKRRYLYSNIRFAPHVEKVYKKYIKYWTDPYQLINARDCDVIWDEIATHLDSTQWKDVSLELKRWLQQHRKYGVEIYGNTQDFPMIDISMRRLTSKVVYLRKMFGSRDKSATKPDPKNIWGIVSLRTVDPDSYTKDKTEYKYTSWNFMTINKKNVAVFDTRQEIKMSKYPPLRKIVRQCPEDGYTRTTYV